jgi:WD40 repeat protein
LIDRYIRVYRKSIEIKPINEFKAHSESVQDIVVLNESSFASCSGDKTIKIWKDSKVVETLEGHSDYVFSLQYSPENHLLISGSKDTTIRLWNTSSSFSLITTMLYHEDSVNSLLFLPNKTFASGSCDKTVIIWKLTTYRMLKSLNKHLDCVNALAIFDSDKYLLTGSTDRAIIIWEISNDYKLSEILRGHQDSVNSLAIYQENIVSASSDKSIIVWSKFKLTFELSAHNGTIWKMCVLSDGLIVSGSYDFEIKIWEKKNQSLKLVAQLTDHKGIIFSLECLKNQSIISSSADKTVKIWKRSDKNYFESVETLEHNDQVTSLTVLSDFIISGEYNGKINVWNESSLELLGNFSSHNNIVWSLVNLNNQSFASASEDTTIKIWEQETYSSSFKCIHNLTDHTSPVWALALLSEKYLISGCNQGLIKIWHLANFTLFKTLTEHRAAVYGFAVLGKESFISVSKDKQTIMWDIENLMKIKALFDKIDVLSVCVLSNDSFATGNSKGTINVWSYFKNFKPIKAISDLKDKVFGLKALNNGLLVSASRNGSLVIWDNSFQSKEIKAHSKAVLALNVFPNDTIISCSEDKTIKTWNTQQYILEKTIY